MKKLSLITLSILACSSQVALANTFFITPMAGYSLGGGVKSEDGGSYDVEGALNYNIAVETQLDSGRVGLFYSQQDSELETYGLESTFRYLHFQSSIYYPINPMFSSYVGLGLGGTQAVVDWSDKEYVFSASMFGGLEYKLGTNIALQAQARWIGSLIDSESASHCTIPTTGESCKIYFSGDWLNQFQANLGFVFRF